MSRIQFSSLSQEVVGTFPSVVPDDLARDYEQSYNDSYPSGNSSPPVRQSTYRQLIFLQPSSYYFCLVEPSRRGGQNYQYVKMTILDGTGSYFWQLIGTLPPAGLWFFRTHDVLLSQVSQIRRYVSVDYHTLGLTKPQIENDTRVLRAIAQHGLKLNSQLQRNAGIKDLRSLKASIERLRQQGILNLAPDGLCGFRLPSEQEIASWTWSNPYQPKKPPAQKTVALHDSQLSDRIIQIIRAKYRRTKGGTSQRDLRSQLSCRPLRIQNLVEDLVLRGQLIDDISKKKRYFPSGS